MNEKGKAPQEKNGGSITLKARDYEVTFQELVGKKAPTFENYEGERHVANGFRCDICRRSFSDDRSYFSHLNSPEHLKALGFSGDVERITDVERIKARIRYNVARLKNGEESKRAAEAQDRKVNALDDVDARRRQINKIREAEKENLVG